MPFTENETMHTFLLFRDIIVFARKLVEDKIKWLRGLMWKKQAVLLKLKMQVVIIKLWNFAVENFSVFLAIRVITEEIF